MEWFDVIIDATYTEILKPDPRAYQACIDALGIDAARCVFVDDQYRNIVGAMNAGMQAVHFDVQQPQKSYQQALNLLSME
jgi:putative hydrolase of the HAD superfamily